MKYAAIGCSASRGCTHWGRCSLLAAVVLTACFGGAPLERPPPTVYTGSPPAQEEEYCAWFGDRRGETLYFGESAFWSTFRASGGDPKADLEVAGPAWIGRFDLMRETMLPPLEVGLPGDRSGVWDVLAHPNGRVYFTTYFGTSGFSDPVSGESRRFEAAGKGLNELALGPEGSILVTRYGASGRREQGGGVVVLDPDGSPIAEHPLAAPDGYIAAPKTAAYDPIQREIWVTTDLLPIDQEGGAPIRHDAYVLDLDGRELRRIADPEIQFIAFAADGTGYRAEVADRKLWLRVMPVAASGSAIGRLRIPLEHAFAAGVDFVQDIQFAPDGRAVVTRWSGWIHVVDATGATQSLRLPPLARDGLYYTATINGQRVCATYCGEVRVVCQDIDSLR